MDQKNKTILALDVGEKRIGVAKYLPPVTIAVPLATVVVDGSEMQVLEKIILSEGVKKIVVGYPRNQSGEATAQTRYVEEFVKKLEPLALDIDFQDESLTSVIAENHLKQEGRPYEKADIDAKAAALILQDYLETQT